MDEGVHEGAYCVSNHGEMGAYACMEYGKLAVLECTHTR